MTDNRPNVLTRFETPPTREAEVTWIESDLSSPPTAVRGLRILLAEDEEPLRACLRMMLEFAGHHVTEAANGAEGLNLFTIGEYDLVITDLEMPVMSGNCFAIGIKSLAPSLPILMISASERARRDTKNPVDALLNKPFTVDELHAALQQLFSGASQSTQPVVAGDVWEPRALSEFN